MCVCLWGWGLHAVCVWGVVHTESVCCVCVYEGGWECARCVCVVCECVVRVCCVCRVGCECRVWAVCMCCVCGGDVHTVCVCVECMCVCVCVCVVCTPCLWAIN